MKNYKYIGLFLLSLGFVSCDVDNELEAIPAEVVANVALNTNGLDFSKYVSVGASFTAGYTDGAMFKAGQENSFPNILAKKFGTDFKQPLMNDNIGGLVFNGATVAQPRFYFDGAGPAVLPATPTTQLGAPVAGPFNNFGAPGAKSFHLTVPGYGALNPYFGRMASSPMATVMGDALAQNPTFFTLSEIGGNDVLGYALSGGSGVDQTGNFDPSTYGGSDITDPNVFAQVFNGMVTALTANGAKGVVANVPYITDLANFTTIPYNSLDPSLPALAPQIDALNAQLYGVLKGIFTAYGEPNRIDVLSKTMANPLLILDEDATDMSAQIRGALTPVLGAPTAGAFGAIFGKARQATENDLILLATLPNIATTVPGVPAPINVNGVSYPLQDQWVLTPQEQMAIKTATDAYNTTIAAVADTNPNVALVDFKGVLTEASTGIMFDKYTMTTSLVTGGLVSLDGVHLTARGYALMANKILAAMDAKFGSNFTSATDGLAKAGDYPTNYSPALR
ncbi:G-D-S-L family lipolytic protein [Polaribacter ponticola]|uniref:G-D-S-L family lipolytic protein n=1 Tax=Polaribacter ponticola TaxID=2978475 RepID=A0ABT5SDQ4_9FLAO|nr:G-D-S-L family lipolytic protein [Polaribacter sp. MSW5]MDD7915586.1 G-D-S-L family lipolytic protein [Polaribacter sp. MSW5]